MKSEDAHLPLWSFKVSALHGSGADNEKPLNYLALKVVWDCLHHSFSLVLFSEKNMSFLKHFRKKYFFPFKVSGDFEMTVNERKQHRRDLGKRLVDLAGCGQDGHFSVLTPVLWGKPVNNSKYIEPSLLSFSLRRTITVRWLRTRVHI